MTSFAVDKVSSYDQILGGYSWLFTPNVGTPQGILVSVVTYSAGGVDNITGVTYGGQALTKIGATVQVHPASGADGYGQTWYLPLNTLSGAQTVAVQKTGIPGANSVSVMVVSYTTTTPETPIAIDTTSRAGGVGTDSHTSITIHPSAPSHITAMAIEPNLGSPSNTSPFAPLVDVLEDDWGISMSNFGQVVGISSPAVYNIGFNYTATTNWGQLLVAVKEGPIVLPGEGAAGFDEWWDVMDGTLSDASDINAAITVPLADLSDVNDSVGTAPTTQDVFVYDHTNDEWTRDSVVDGGTP